MNEKVHQKRLMELAVANIQNLIEENEKLKADNDFLKVLLDVPVEEEEADE